MNKVPDDTRWLVCGGREFGAWKAMEADLTLLATERGYPSVVIHGGAPGADLLAGMWAFRQQVRANVYKADWSRHGKVAGPIRNQQMLTEGMPGLVIAFPGGRGTADMVQRAYSAGLEVILCPRSKAAQHEYRRWLEQQFNELLGSKGEEKVDVPAG